MGLGPRDPRALIRHSPGTWDNGGRFRLSIVLGTPRGRAAGPPRSRWKTRASENTPADSQLGRQDKPRTLAGGRGQKEKKTNGKREGKAHPDARQRQHLRPSDRPPPGRGVRLSYSSPPPLLQRDAPTRCPGAQRRPETGEHGLAPLARADGRADAQQGHLSPGPAPPPPAWGHRPVLLRGW